MKLIDRKGEPERVLETVSETASNPLGAVSGRVNRSTLVKGGLIAGGLAALTAGSAAISSLRRRQEGKAS